MQLFFIIFLSFILGCIFTFCFIAFVIKYAVRHQMLVYKRIKKEDRPSYKFTSLINNSTTISL